MWEQSAVVVENPSRSGREAITSGDAWGQYGSVDWSGREINNSWSD